MISETVIGEGNAGLNYRVPRASSQRGDHTGQVIRVGEAVADEENPDLAAGAGLGLRAIAGQNRDAEQEDNERKSHPAAMP